MSILSDKGILIRMHCLHPMPETQCIVIDPFDEAALQGASIDLKLGREVKDEYGQTYYLTDEDNPIKYYLHPKHACLAHTLEFVQIPTDCVGRVEGKSSIGRRMVSVHQTAGWIDPGFYGNITLEIVNNSSAHIFEMSAGMPICQLTFLTLDEAADRIYKGKYQGDKGAHGDKTVWKK